MYNTGTKGIMNRYLLEDKDGEPWESGGREGGSQGSGGREDHRDMVVGMITGAWC